MKRIHDERATVKLLLGKVFRSLLIFSRLDCRVLFFSFCGMFSVSALIYKRAESGNSAFLPWKFRAENLRKLSLANIKLIGFAAVNRFLFFCFIHQVISLGLSAPGFVHHGLHNLGFTYAINPGFACPFNNMGKGSG